MKNEPKQLLRILVKDHNDNNWVFYFVLILCRRYSLDTRLRSGNSSIPIM